MALQPQATSLPFIVAATAIGMNLGPIDSAGSAALTGAVLLFPLAGLVLLRNASGTAVTEPHVHRGGFDVPDPAHR